MSKRLQVVMTDDEFEELQRVARCEGMTVSDLVRRALREARISRTPVDTDTKLAVLRNAVHHNFPTADIEDVLADIERGY